MAAGSAAPETGSGSAGIPDGRRCPVTSAGKEPKKNFARSSNGWMNMAEQVAGSPAERFFPRLDGGEMWSRWDMQDAPPDILITNYSMLNIMLMRDIERPIFRTDAPMARGRPRSRLSIWSSTNYTATGARPARRLAISCGFSIAALGLHPGPSPASRSRVERFAWRRRRPRAGLPQGSFLGGHAVSTLSVAVPRRFRRMREPG